MATVKIGFVGCGAISGIYLENITKRFKEIEIIGVADAFDAMTANRVYRKQMDFSYVLGELEKGRGTQFDPQYVDKLLQLIHEGTIDLNKIYHVSKEDSERAEEAAKEGGQA